MSTVQESTVTQVDYENWRESLHALPEVPQDIHDFGSVIEHTKRMLAMINQHASDLKECAERIRKVYADNVRGDKASLSEKDKREVAVLCEADEALKGLDDSIRLHTELAIQWEARGSRLRRDFEVRLIDYRANVIGNAGF